MSAQMTDPSHRLLDDYDFDGSYCELCLRNGREDTQEIWRRLDTFDRRIDDGFLDPEVFRPDNVLADYRKRVRTDVERSGC